MVYKTKEVGRRNIRFVEIGTGGNPILYLGGLFMPAAVGIPFFNKLTQLDKNLRIIAPEIYAGRFVESQPRNMREYAEL